MKLNWVERLVVNNPLRLMEQHLIARWFKAMHDQPSGCRILEIGCGRGAGARLILNKFEPEHLYLLDLDQRMIKSARGYLTPAEKNEVSFYVGDAVDLPFGSAFMDAVFGFGFLHHVPVWRTGLREITRVLKPGGTYYLEELYPSLYQNLITKRLLVHPDCDRFSSQDLKDALQAAGLRLEHTFELKKLGILAVATKARS